MGDVPINEVDAKRICNKILDLDQTILGSSMMDKGGSIIVTMSKPLLQNLFDLRPDIKSNSGVAATMIRGMARDMERVFGATRSIVSIHRDSTLMLIPAITEFDEELLIGLVVQPSGNFEHIIEKVERSLMDFMLQQR